jgi:y4mF family transcriptional regulator
MWAHSAAEVGKIIIAARRHRDLTQTELARAIGATQSWVSEVEQGKDTAQIGKILRTLSYLGVHLRTGVTPWRESKSRRSPRAGASLSDIIDAHTKPKRSSGGT